MPRQRAGASLPFLFARAQEVERGAGGGWAVLSGCAQGECGFFVRHRVWFGHLPVKGDFINLFYNFVAKVWHTCTNEDIIGA